MTLGWPIGSAILRPAEQSRADGLWVLWLAGVFFGPRGATNPTVVQGVLSADTGPRCRQRRRNVLVRGDQVSGTPRDQVAYTIIKSQEGRDRIVLGLYVRYLHRAADSGGLGYLGGATGGGRRCRGDDDHRVVF